MKVLAQWQFSMLLVVGSALNAAEPLPRIPPKEPAEALKTFVVRDGFEMQLLAAEPVAMEYDENGRVVASYTREWPPATSFVPE